jgi:hypothetical protein
VEVIEKRGRGDRPWRIRYKDNPDDPIHCVAGFATRADALEWLAEHPVYEVDDEDNVQE